MWPNSNDKGVNMLISFCTFLNLLKNGDHKIEKMTCQHCSKKMVGRSDKRFCSIKCKNGYHRQIKLQSKSVVDEIDNILHRNHAICLEVMKKEKTEKIKIPKLVLEKMGFSFHYYTGSYLNNQNKMYYYIYDFQWMEFSTQEVLLFKSDYKRIP